MSCSKPLVDAFNRRVTYLRLSVTDRCDLRCSYCMPEKMTFLPRKDVLSLEELHKLSLAMIERGVSKIRLTGGEPLVRRDMIELVQALGRKLGDGLEELTLTTNGTQLAQFADGFPWLLISEESLQALNRKLPKALPMNRFRPNIVIAGVEPFEEDDLDALSTERVALRPVKPCTRCAITTTDQQRGERDGEEPLRTLRSFRFNRELKGVAFGQNAVLIRGAGEWLEVGQELRVERRAS